MGAGTYLKERKPEVSLVAVEPAESAVITGGRPGYHQIQGIGAGFVPAILDTSVIDETVRVGAYLAACPLPKLVLTLTGICWPSSGLFECACRSG